jgi:hypothetical protein
MISIGTTILGFLRLYNEKIRPSAPFSPLTVKNESEIIQVWPKRYSSIRVKQKKKGVK